MMVLTDTSVWSLALRRRPQDLNSREQSIVGEWSSLVQDGRIRLIGPVRQELLSGIRLEEHFRALERKLAAFPDTALTSEDYVQAARFFNTCRAQGITGTAVDLLLCAVAARLRWRVFTVDPDFERYGRHLPVRLHRAASFH